MPDHGPIFEHDRARGFAEKVLDRAGKGVGGHE
jgi:hypothetical protein